MLEFGDIDESLSHTPRVYQIRTLALCARGSLPGWVMCPPEKLIAKSLFGQQEPGR